MLLKKLTMANALPGNENEVRSIIKEEIKEYATNIRVDRMGNIIAEKKINDGPTILVSAHMDEVGLMVKGIDSSGLIKFAPVGGIDPRILVSKVVEIGSKKLQGVIGAKPIHLQKANEQNTPMPISSLYIDIGASNKEEASKHVEIGDYIGFKSEYIEFGNNKVKAKALDNRIGCSFLVDLMKEELDYNIIAAFVVQEEIGLRGSAIAANQIEADFGIILEGTTCGDMTDVDAHLQTTEVDKGPAISMMDRTTIYKKDLLKKITKIAEDNEIKWQFRRNSFGGNDTGRFHTAKTGMDCISIAVPCRYIHSPVSVMSKLDYDNTKKLLLNIIKNAGKEGLLNE